MKYSELPEEIQQKVLDKYRYINIEHLEWYEYTIDRLKEELENEYGFENVKIYFSGFGNQGDGASFTGRLVNLKMFLEKTGIDPSLRFDSTGSNYSHERTVRIDFEYLESEIEDWRIDKCHEIYNALEEEYEYLISDEQIIERIEANDYDFDENGRLQ